MRSENRAEKTLLLLLNDKPAAIPITAIPAVDRWGKWPLILARPHELALSFFLSFLSFFLSFFPYFLLSFFCRPFSPSLPLSLPPSLPPSLSPSLTESSVKFQKKRSRAQMKDQVMRMNSINKSSKSEPSSRFFGRLKLRPVDFEF